LACLQPLPGFLFLFLLSPAHSDEPFPDFFAWPRPVIPLTDQSRAHPPNSTTSLHFFLASPPLPNRTGKKLFHCAQTGFCSRPNILFLVWSSGFRALPAAPTHSPARAFRHPRPLRLCSFLDASPSCLVSCPDCACPIEDGRLNNHILSAANSKDGNGKKGEDTDSKGGQGKGAGGPGGKAELLQTTRTRRTRKNILTQVFPCSCRVFVRA
jgi:hypothetical protein